MPTSLRVWLILPLYSALPLLRIPSDSLTESPLDTLRLFISSLPTSTSVQSAVQVLTRLLLLHTANATGCSHLLLGTSLTSLAISLISQVSQGGGFAIADERQEEWTPPVSPEDRPIDDVGEGHGKRNRGHKKRRAVRVVRPLRDIGMKECAAWAWWKSLSGVEQLRLEPPNRQSIGSLTKGTSFSRINISPSCSSRVKNLSSVSRRTTHPLSPR